MRRYFAAGIWLGITVTATLIVWAAVSVVAADVTDRPAPVVAHRDVVVALQGGSSGESAPATTITTSSTAVAPHAVAPPTTSPLARATGGRSAPPSGPVVGQVTTTTTTLHVASPTTKPPSHPSPPSTTAPPTTSTPVGATATYSTDGGVVAVACTSFNSIRLVAALPNDGFQAVATSSGPFFVQVNFVGPGRNIPVSAACFFGQPFQFNKNGTTSSGG